MVGLPISTYVNINTAIAAGGVLRTDFGTGLLVTVDDAIPAGGAGKVQRFRDLEAVQGVFAAGDVVDDSAVWFGADPAPKSLYVGRWATAAVASSFEGGAPFAAAGIAIANAAFRVNGGNVLVDLSDDTTYAALAASIQAALTTGRVARLVETTPGAGYQAEDTMGQVVSVAVTNVGARYTGADTVTVTVSGGGSPTTDAVIEATVNVDGEIELEIVNPGAGYSSAPTLAISAPSDGGGTQATATATLGEADDSPTVTFTGGDPARTAAASVTINADGTIDVDITDGGAGYRETPVVVITVPATGTQAVYTAELGPIVDSLAAATFTYSAVTGKFTLALAGTGPINIEAPTEGVDIRNALGFVSGFVSRQGSDAESITEAVTRMLANAVGGTPVALMLGSDVPLTVGTVDTRDAMAAFAQAGDYVFGLLDTADQALVTGDATSHVARAFANQQSHVEPVYSKSGERPDIGLLALMSSQNLGNPASIITPHLKPLPGVQPTEITETQRVELVRKRANVYTTVGGLPSLVGGYAGKAGSWLDAVWWLLWIKNEMEINIFNAQRASRRFNTAQLGDTIAQVMRTAVQSGGAQPGGKVSASIKQDIIQTTGNYDFDGILPSGHLTWIELPSARSDLDRENRVGKFKTWIAPADAIHEVTGDITLSG